LILTPKDADWTWIMHLAAEGSLPAVLLMHSHQPGGTVCLICSYGFSFNYYFNIGLSTTVFLKSDGEKTAKYDKTEGEKRMGFSS